MLSQVFFAGQERFGQARVFRGGFAPSGRPGDGFGTDGAIEEGEQGLRGGADESPVAFVDKEGVALRIATAEAMQCGVDAERLGATPVEGSREDDLLE